MRPHGFKGLTEILNLDEEQIRSMVLGNWHKLNKVLMSEPPIAALRKLMVVELSGAARPDILIRLRSALSKANSMEAKEAMNRIIVDIKAERPELSTFDMYMLGLIGGEPQLANKRRLEMRALAKAIKTHEKGKRKK
jgi:hypothetical protein